MSMHLMDPIRVPIRRKEGSKQIDLCFPNWMKWAGGVFATLSTSSLVAAVGLLFSMSATQATFKNEITNIKQGLNRIEAKVEKVRDDPFTGSDADALRKDMIEEMDRRERRK